VDEMYLPVIKDKQNKHILYVRIRGERQRERGGGGSLTQVQMMYRRIKP
jgi:hypothetical protein